MKKVKLYLSILILSITLITPITVNAAPSPTTNMVIIPETKESKEQTEEQTKTQNKNLKKPTKKYSLRKKRKLQKLRKIRKTNFQSKGDISE